MGWWLLRLSAKILALLRLSVNFFQLRLTKKVKNLFLLFQRVKYYYYSLKVFPRFRLAKSTIIIHHNHLLMTKFGRILFLVRK